MTNGRKIGQQQRQAGRSNNTPGRQAGRQAKS